MGKPLRILLQATTIPRDNDWTIERFSLLREYSQLAPRRKWRSVDRGDGA